MGALKVKQSALVDEIKTNIECGIHKTGYCVVEDPIVFVHKAKQVDKETCESMGYEVYEAYYNGGTIVADKGGVAIIHFERLYNGWMMRFLAYFLEWLKGKGLNATYESNDILVDGYKVCGLCVTRYGRIDYTAGFIGINTNLDHIRAICRKPMVKVPKGLSDYGITTEEIEEMFLDFCRQDGCVRNNPTINYNHTT